MASVRSDEDVVKANKETFGKFSKIYGKGWDNDVHHVKVLDWLKANVLPKLPEKDVDVLDFGCGPGITVMTLTGIEKIRSIVGLDLSDKMVEQFNENVQKFKDDLDDDAKAKFPEISTLNFELKSSSQVDQRFDLIYTIGVMHHVPDLAGITKTISKLLKPGGIFVVLDTDVDSEDFFKKNVPKEMQHTIAHHGIPRATLRKHFEDTGLLENISIDYAFDTQMTRLKGEHHHHHHGHGHDHDGGHHHHGHDGGHHGHEGNEKEAGQNNDAAKDKDASDQNGEEKETIHFRMYGAYGFRKAD